MHAPATSTKLIVNAVAIVIFTPSLFRSFPGVTQPKRPFNEGRANVHTDREQNRSSKQPRVDLAMGSRDFIQGRVHLCCTVRVYVVVSD
jgi:hypothetical protein